MLPVLPTALRAQQAALTSVVVDAVAGTPAPFAVVEIKARRVGEQASAQGTFALDLSGAPAATASLRVSSLGFVPYMLAVPLVSPYRLVLRPLAVALPEAVVRTTLAPLVRLGSATPGSSSNPPDS